MECRALDRDPGNPEIEEEETARILAQKIGGSKDKVTDDDNDQVGNANKITICHKTESAKNPHVEITVSADAIKDGHGAHEGDLIPAPVGGCPDTVITDEIPAK